MKFWGPAISPGFHRLIQTSFITSKGVRPDALTFFDFYLISSLIGYVFPIFFS